MELKYENYCSDGTIFVPLSALLNIGTIKDCDVLCIVCKLDETCEGKQWDRYFFPCKRHIAHTRCYRKWLHEKQKVICPTCGDLYICYECQFVTNNIKEKQIHDKNNGHHVLNNINNKSAFFYNGKKYKIKLPLPYELGDSLIHDKTFDKPVKCRLCEQKFNTVGLTPIGYVCNGCMNTKWKDVTDDEGYTMLDFLYNTVQFKKNRV